MRTTLLVTFCVLLSIMILGCKDDNADISGRYEGNQTFQSTTSAITVVINCNSTQLTGSVTPPGSDQPLPFRNGVCSDRTITFESQQESVIFHYSATYSPGDVASASLSGSISAINSSGSFTARFVSKN